MDEHNVVETDDTNVSTELDTQETGPSKATKFKEEVISWAKAIAVAAVVAFIVNNFIIVNAMVPTGSMETTIMTDDRIVAFRLSYLFSEPERFDIVVFENPADRDVLFIKRIIGMPGETVLIANGGVYINGERLYSDEQFIKEPFGGNAGPFVVGAGEYFVLGDNRNNSDDSRAWLNPFVPAENILGRAIFQYFPRISLLH